ncbi:ABC transporter permease [Phyllobacterium sp. OV277]|uniref:ABC transporter permease n=1 Tax=Phyllobacterium sp. OV277 TaxID=1882772 RepID=UPI0008914082|nr:ABC transporter permease [Phyllobacterium sp. OV277]SDP39419.1 ABC-2 type transport system permease protein [Phyllobacterium sp. OV277]
MSGVVGVYRHELKRIFELKAIFSTLFVAALIYAVYYPQPYRNEALRDVPVAIIDLDGTTSSRELARRIDASSDVAVAMVLPDLATAEREVFKRTLSGAVVIPLNFERDLLHGRSSPISLYADSSYFLIYSRVAGAVTGVARAYGAEVETARLIGFGINPAVAASAVGPMPLVSIPLFNPQSGYATYLLPGAFAIIMQQTLLIAVCLLATMSNKPSAANLHISYAGAISSVLGKLAAYLTIAAVIVPFYFILLPYFYNIPRLGSIVVILVAAIPFVLSVSALGLVLGSLFRSPLAVQLTAAALGMPLFFLSGFSWPIEAVPPFLRALSQLIPGSIAIAAMTQVVEMGASIADIRNQFLGLWALALGYTILAALLEWRGSNKPKSMP